MKKAVYKDGGVVLSGLSAGEVVKIKEGLTFENPAYATAKKYSRYGYTNVPRYLTYYEKNKEGYKVPVGYFDPEHFKGKIENTRNSKLIGGFPKFVLKLRKTQQEAADRFLSSNDTLCSHRIKGCIQLPTGKGKTILALYIAAELKCKTLVVVHKSDLVTGWLKDIKLAFGGKMKAGLIKAQSREIGKYITLATIQTLNRLSEDELKKLYNNFGFVIQDEMHHCPASTFGVVSNFNAAFKLGLTATPERNDGLEHVMQLYFGDFCYCYEQKEGEIDEDILPVKVKYQTLGVTFNPICREAGRSFKVVDFKNRPLKEGECHLTDIPYQSRPKVQHLTVDKEVCELIKETVCKDILKMYHKGYSCIVFFTQVECLLSYYDYLLNSVEDEQLDDILSYYGNRKFNDGNLSIAQNRRNTVTLTTYAKTSEGTDCRMWEVAFLVSSLNNGKNVEQAIGRIRRTSNTPKLKTAVVYDYRLPNVYGYSRHFDTRLLRYRKLKFDVKNLDGDNGRKKLFMRGFKRIT